MFVPYQAQFYQICCRCMDINRDGAQEQLCAHDFIMIQLKVSGCTYGYELSRLLVFSDDA
jgi:hypothetical protein